MEIKKACGLRSGIPKQPQAIYIVYGNFFYMEGVQVHLALTIFESEIGKPLLADNEFFYFTFYIHDFVFII